MLSHYSKCRKNTENVDPKVLKTKNLLYLLVKKSSVMKEQEVKIPLSKISLLGDIIF